MNSAPRRSRGVTMPMLTLPDQRHWVDFARNREFPLSGVLTVLLHCAVLGLLLFGLLQFLFETPPQPPIVLEAVLLSPGAGTQGPDTELRRGAPTGTDVIRPIDERVAMPWTKPATPDAEVVAPNVQPKLPDDPDGTPIRPEKLTP